MPIEARVWLNLFVLTSRSLLRQVNRIREYPEAQNIVATHSDSPKVRQTALARNLA